MPQPRQDANLAKSAQRKSVMLEGRHLLDCDFRVVLRVGGTSAKVLLNRIKLELCQIV